MTATRSLIFLDVDGVLNNHSWNAEAQSCSLHPDCVRAFNRILLACNPRIVVSSAWRYMIAGGAMTLQGFGYLLRTHGVAHTCDIVGITPLDEVVAFRGDQIAEWMKREPAYVRYVVLDDNDLLISACGHPLVWTNGGTGLTEKDADRAIAMLGGTQ